MCINITARASYWYGAGNTKKYILWYLTVRSACGWLAISTRFWYVNQNTARSKDPGVSGFGVVPPKIFTVRLWWSIIRPSWCVAPGRCGGMLVSRGDTIQTSKPERNTQNSEQKACKQIYENSDRIQTEHTTNTLTHTYTNSAYYLLQLQYGLDNNGKHDSTMHISRTR